MMMDWLVQNPKAIEDARFKKVTIGTRDLIVFMHGLATPLNADYVYLPVLTGLPRDGKLELVTFGPNYMNMGFDALLYHPSWDVVPFGEEPPRIVRDWELVKCMRHKSTSTDPAMPKYDEIDVPEIVG